MNPLTRWDPLKMRWHPIKDLEEMEHRLATFFGRSPARPGGGREEMTVAEWMPLVDITEDEKEYLIKAELPELSKDDLRVTVENGTLILSGERKFEKEENTKKYHRIERSYGSFVRSFGLPDDADAEKVNAEFKDGVLKIHIAKSEAARPKQIEVQVS